MHLLVTSRVFKCSTQNWQHHGNGTSENNIYYITTTLHSTEIIINMGIWNLLQVVCLHNKGNHHNVLNFSPDHPSIENDTILLEVNQQAVICICLVILISICHMWWMVCRQTPIQIVLVRWIFCLERPCQQNNCVNSPEYQNIRISGHWSVILQLVDERVMQNTMAGWAA